MSKFLKDIKIPIAIAGTSLGMGLVGKGLGYAPLEEAGATSAKFVAPAVNITMAGVTIDMLKDLRKVNKSRMEDKK